MNIKEPIKNFIITSIQRNQALLIDFDGTLMDYPLNEKSALQKLFSDIKLPDSVHLQALKDFVSFNANYWRQFDLKKISIDKARIGGFEDLAEKFKIKKDAQQLNKMFLDCLIQTTVIENEIIASLKILKELGTKLIIITNGSHETQSKRLENSGLLNIIDTFFTSESVGFPKPHPKIFLDSKNFLESIDCPTNDLWVVGDSFEADIKGAFDVGFNTCWITNDKNNSPNDFEKEYPSLIANNFLDFVEFYRKIKNSS